VHENSNMSICWVDNDISVLFLLYLLIFFWHLIDSHHNTTIVLELT
jgi:hypothetical protein